MRTQPRLKPQSPRGCDGGMEAQLAPNLSQVAPRESHLACPVCVSRTEAVCPRDCQLALWRSQVATGHALVQEQIESGLCGRDAGEVVIGGAARMFTLSHRGMGKHLHRCTCRKKSDLKHPILASSDRALLRESSDSECQGAGHNCSQPDRSLEGCAEWVR